jgi:sugar phosphate permease
MATPSDADALSPIGASMTGEENGGPTRVRYQVVAAGCLLALVAYVHRLAFAMFAPDMKREFALSDQDVGYLMAAFLISYGAAQIPCGVLGDRLGARMLLTIVVAGWSLVTMAIGFVPGEAVGSWLLPGVLRPLAMLLALRVLFGVLQSGAFSALTRVIADWVPITRRAFAQGTIWTSTRLGGALMPFLLTWLLVRCGGWRMPLEILGALGLVYSAAFVVWFRNRPEQVSRVNGMELALIRAGRSPPDTSLATPWGRVVASRNVWSLCLMYGCCGPAGNFMLTLLPTYLREHRQISSQTADWLIGLPLAAGFVACSMGGWMSDAISRWTSRKWGRRAVGAVGLSAAAIAFASIAWVENVWWVGLFLCAAQFGNDFSVGPAWAACADIGERHAGTLSGIMNMTSNITGAAGAAIAGHLFAGGHSTWVFFGFGAIWALGALCWLGVDVTKTLSA